MARLFKVKPKWLRWLLGGVGLLAGIIGIVIAGYHILFFIGKIQYSIGVNWLQLITEKAKDINDPLFMGVMTVIALIAIGIFLCGSKDLGDKLFNNHTNNKIKT